METASKQPQPQSQNQSERKPMATSPKAKRLAAWKIILAVVVLAFVVSFWLNERQVIVSRIVYGWPILKFGGYSNRGGQ